MAIAIRPKPKTKTALDSIPGYPDLERDPRITSLVTKAADATKTHEAAVGALTQARTNLEAAQSAFDAVERQWLLNEATEASLAKARQARDDVKLAYRRAEARLDVAQTALAQADRALAEARVTLAEDRQAAIRNARSAARVELYRALRAAAVVNDHLYELYDAAIRCGLPGHRDWWPALGAGDTAVPFSQPPFQESLIDLERDLRTEGLL